MITVKAKRGPLPTIVRTFEDRKAAIRCVIAFADLHSAEVDDYSSDVILIDASSYYAKAPPRKADPSRVSAWTEVDG